MEMLGVDLSPLLACCYKQMLRRQPVMQCDHCRATVHELHEPWICMVPIKTASLWRL